MRLGGIGYSYALPRVQAIRKIGPWFLKRYPIIWVFVTSALVGCRTQPSSHKNTTIVAKPSESGQFGTRATPVAIVTSEPTVRSLLREERAIQINGAVETWRISWDNTPTLVCLRWDCVCSDFMYAERGKAHLSRAREGSVLQDFPLASIYSSGFDLPERLEFETILPAWPKEAGDEQVTDDTALAEKVRSRHSVPIFDLHDYDRDGHATEFLLPVGGVGCAFHGYVALGISRIAPAIHVFGTATHPKEPLVLRRNGWQILRDSGQGKYIDVPCGDRGADTETEIELKTDAAGIHVIERQYACPRTPERLLSYVER